MSLGLRLEQIVIKLSTPVRISPIGAVTFAVGTVGTGAFFVAALNVGDLPAPVRSAMKSMSALMISYFPSLLAYAQGLMFYRRAMEEMKMPSASSHISKIIEPYLHTYCERNACHAAAAVSGFDKRFHELVKLYPKEKVLGPRHRFLPGV